MGERAIFLLRHVGKLAQEQVAEHKRDREDGEEHRKPPIRDWLRVRILMMRPRMQMLVVFWHRFTSRRDVRSHFRGASDLYLHGTVHS